MPQRASEWVAGPRRIAGAVRAGEDGHQTDEIGCIRPRRGRDERARNAAGSELRVRGPTSTPGASSGRGRAKVLTRVLSVPWSPPDQTCHRLVLMRHAPRHPVGVVATRQVSSARLALFGCTAPAAPVQGAPKAWVGRRTPTSPTRTRWIRRRRRRGDGPGDGEQAREDQQAAQPPKGSHRTGSLLGRSGPDGADGEDRAGIRKPVTSAVTISPGHKLRNWSLPRWGTGG